MGPIIHLQKDGGLGLKKKTMQLVFLLAACASIIAVILICVFMFGNGVQPLEKIGVVEFLTGTYGNRLTIHMAFCR